MLIFGLDRLWYRPSAFVDQGYCPLLFRNTYLDQPKLSQLSLVELSVSQRTAVVCAMC